MTDKTEIVNDPKAELKPETKKSLVIDHLHGGFVRLERLSGKYIVVFNPNGKQPVWIGYKELAEAMARFDQDILAQEGAKKND